MRRSKLKKQNIYIYVDDGLLLANEYDRATNEKMKRNWPSFESPNDLRRRQKDVFTTRPRLVSSL